MSGRLQKQQFQCIRDANENVLYKPIHYITLQNPSNDRYVEDIRAGFGIAFRANTAVTRNGVKNHLVSK